VSVVVFLLLALAFAAAGYLCLLATAHLFELYFSMVQSAEAEWERRFWWLYLGYAFVAIFAIGGHAIHAFLTSI
jgi:hypothetical protein